MECPACGRAAALGDRFCGGCGASLSGATGHSVNTGGGPINASVYQAGRDVIVTAAPDQHAATYQAEPLWRSPITQGILAWVGLVLGLTSVVPIGGLIKSFYRLFSNGILAAFDETKQYDPFNIANIILLMAIALLAILTWRLRRVAKKQLRVPLWWGLALNGAGRRITVEKIRAHCPICGGKMRYYNKATKWIDHINTNGSRRREVTETMPALECRRNPQHWFTVDPAEQQET